MEKTFNLVAILTARLRAVLRSSCQQIIVNMRKVAKRESAKKAPVKAAKIPKAGTPMAVKKQDFRADDKKRKPRKQFKTSVYVLSGE